jgi:hypothetical protein
MYLCIYNETLIEVFTFCSPNNEWYTQSILLAIIWMVESITGEKGF